MVQAMGHKETSLNQKKHTHTHTGKPGDKRNPWMGKASEGEISSSGGGLIIIITIDINIFPKLML